MSYEGTVVYCKVAWQGFSNLNSKVKLHCATIH